jgi:fluoride ion exporter CrcB/FEX
MVPAFVYGLCMLTALMCAVLLMQAYRRTKYRLLLWVGIFFCITTASNLILMVDKMVMPDVDLTVYRYAAAVFGLCVLLPGLIFEKE